MSLDQLTDCYSGLLADSIGIVCDAWIEGWTIQPEQTLSDWADEFREVAKGTSPQSGQWRTSLTPYVREIQDSLSDHSRVRIVDFKKSAQIGATEVGINFTGYVIDRGQGSMIVAQPVKDLARSWSTSKFEPAIALMPNLNEKIESDNTLEKRFPGGTVWVIWTNSSNQLRSRTARYLFEDEYDEYPEDLNGQGTAASQLEARVLAYGNRAKIYRACTPTVANKSQIDAKFQEGDQRHFKLRCPHCKFHQVLKIENLTSDGKFICQGHSCGLLIEEHHKEEMLRERSKCSGCNDHIVRIIHHVDKGGVFVFADECKCGIVLNPDAPDGAYWEPTNPDADKDHRSYHIWTAYSPSAIGITWKEIAAKKKHADENPSALAGFTNLILGEVYEGERKQQDSNEVAELAEPGIHRGIVPAGGLIITAGIDCQHDRFEVKILAHGRGQRARVVDYAVIDGDPSRPDGYGELDKYLLGTWRNTHGIEMHIHALGIDGGNWTEMVAQYVKSKVGSSGKSRVVKVGDHFEMQAMYLLRGRSEKKSERAVYRPLKSEVNAREKTVARSVGIWGVGTSVLKHILYGWLSSAITAKAEAEKAGAAEDIDARMIRFPGGRGEAYDPIHPDPGALPPSYYAGLVCEYFDEEAKQWIKPKGKANEQLDTCIYAMWCALSPAIKIDAMRESQWVALEAKYQPPATDLFNSNQTPRETNNSNNAETANNASRETSVSNSTHTKNSTGSWGGNNDNDRGWGND